MTDEHSGGLTYLGKQAAEIIDEETTAAELVVQLDVDIYEQDDPHQNRPQTKPFAPMFRTVLLRELEDDSDPAVAQQLAENPDVARPLGFDPTEVPDRSTIYRARTDRFEGLERTIRTAVRQIRRLAAEAGSPIGPRPEPDEDSGTSPRTEERLIRKKMKDVMDELETVVFPAFDFDRPEEAIYDEDDLLTLEALMGIKNLSANDGGKALGDQLDPDVDAPFYEDGPTGETLLEDVKELDPEDISEMVNRAAMRTLTRAKPYMEFRRPVTLAIDITYVAYYPEERPEEMIRLQGAPDDKDYRWCHKFATAAIVGENVHFTVAMLPVGNAAHHDEDAYPGEDKTHRAGNVVRELLYRATQQVSLHRMVADREFYAADAIAACEEFDVEYIIPVPENDRSKQFMRRLDDEVIVKEEYGLHGPIKGGVTNDRVETTLVGLPPDENYDSKQVFATNADDIGDDTYTARARTKAKIERYDVRAGIEVSYRKIKEFAAWTSSRSFEVRLWHFGFAVLLYNCWLLVDFLVKVSIDVVEYHPTPRVSAERFRRFFEKFLLRLT